MSEKPHRVRRLRERGWRMPPNTVYVGRPTKWGNPWTPAKYWDAGFSGSIEVAKMHCVEAYKAWLLGQDHWAHGELKEVPSLEELRGKNLACWCHLSEPCHADVLLEIANQPNRNGGAIAMNERDAQVGTNGGLSQRWREVEYEGVAPSSFTTYRSCAKQLDAAKLRIEEAMKALLENSNAPANNTYYSRFRDGQRVTCEAVLKIIREIL